LQVTAEQSRVPWGLDVPVRRACLPSMLSSVWYTRMLTPVKRLRGTEQGEDQGRVVAAGTILFGMACIVAYGRV